jgi:hypothetical protein
MLKLRSTNRRVLLQRGCCQVLFCAAGLLAQGVQHVTLSPDGRFLIDGAATFPIGYTSGPMLGGLSPARNNGLAELKKAGYVFQLWYCPPHQWGRERESYLDALLQESLQQGTRVVISIADLQHTRRNESAKAAELRRVVLKYRNHPSLLFWKGEDEPQWGKIPPEDLRLYYETIHSLDPNHPIWITQAPRGTADDLRPYSRFYDIGAIDIYPVSYPPGYHSGTDNKELSVVGDYTREIQDAGNHSKATMMVLQICWSGVYKPGKTLRFPTFPEERYMTYDAIINGARGLVFFGGNVRACWNDQDTAFGWNWTFYNRALRPVLDELRPEGPLYPALIAPASKLPVHADTSAGLEIAVRESGEFIYVLAARGEAETSQVTLTGLPNGIKAGDLLYEDPRTVQVTDGTFVDWFAPHEVHLYRFRRPAPVATAPRAGN